MRPPPLPETPPRTPARDDHDVEILLDLSSAPPGRAVVLVKLTLDVADGACRPAPAEPLLHDFRDPDLVPRFRPGSDFWPYKAATDVVVQGSAFARSPVPRMDVSVQVGEAVKRVAVFGRRAVRWLGDGCVRFEDPEPLVEVPLTWQNAYGGLDWRVPLDDPEDVLAASLLDVDHPGLYPRNPWGRGYLVLPGEVPDYELPNLEDPDDLLTPERLIVRDPRLWYRQPLPWCLDWTSGATFPRKVLFAGELDAWYPGPDDERMPEVRRGSLPAGYRAMMEDRALDEGPHPGFCQEASCGLALPALHGGEPVVIRGMHPERDEVAFRLPAPPSIEIAVEDDRRRVEPRLHNVVCRPAEGRLTLTYATERDLTRMFVPGVHGRIPVSVSVAGGEPVAYAAPVPIRDRLAEAERRAREDARKRRRPDARASR